MDLGQIDESIARSGGAALDDTQDATYCWPMSEISGAVEAGFFRASAEVQWDILALGEVMLRFDPGEGRIHTCRQFGVGEGGGEYNVARGWSRVFGKKAGILTALVDNPVGQLVESLILSGGVDASPIRWVPGDGAGRLVRNGLNFTERGFGPRAGLGCSDRGHTAISQLRPEDIDWQQLLAGGVGLLHTGGIYAALGEHSPDVAEVAMKKVREQGGRVSYDLNYRPSLWGADQERAQVVNRRLVSEVDILFGNEEDFCEALGFRIEGLDVHRGGRLDHRSYVKMLREVARQYPQLRVIATSLRVASSATENLWGGLLYQTERDEVAYIEPQSTLIL
ncbi:MAG: sugar kinase, partial [Polyangiaceae bacterium]|nr:sugar kinase [Polyangiaceae bacterium]